MLSIRLVISLIFLSFFSCIFVNDADSQLIGELKLPHGDPYRIYVEDDYAYLASVFVVDTSDVDQTKLVSRYITTKAQDICVQNRLAYIANGDEGLKIVDFSDFELPKLLSVCETGGYLKRVCIHGNYAYVAESTRLVIINIAEPESPFIESSLPLSGDVKNIYIGNGYVFAASYGFGLYIINISDPANPKIVNTLSRWSDIEDVYVLGEYAYITCQEKGLIIIDVSNVYKLHSISRRAVEGKPMSIQIVDNIAYIACHPSLYGLQMFDVSDPENPVPYGKIRSSHGGFVDVFVSDDRAYAVSIPMGLYIIDIRIPSSLDYIGGYNMARKAKHLFVRDGYAYVPDSEAGLHIIDVSNPYSPLLVSTRHILWSSAQDIYVKENKAYIADRGNGLVIVDISDPFYPIIDQYFKLPFESTDISGEGNYLYLVGTRGGEGVMAMIDISDPYSPEITKLRNLHISLVDKVFPTVFLSGSKAYITAGSNGVLIVDVSDPYDPPIAVNQSNDFGCAIEIFVQDNYCYVTDEKFGLKIFEIVSDNLIPLGSVPMPTGAAGIYVFGDYAYIGSGEKKGSYFYIVNISNKLEPWIVETFETPGIAWGSYVLNGYTYLADDDTIRIYQNDFSAH